jgi:hypothetical protein
MDAILMQFIDLNRIGLKPQRGLQLFVVLQLKLEAIHGGNSWRQF